MTTSPEWSDIISEVTSAPGVVMTIGAVDTGKTTFCLQLANAAVEAGIATAVVDSDLGQSEIGAPGTVGMAMMESPVESLSDLKPKRLYFVGATTPAGHMLESVVGTKKLVDAAIGLGAQMVVLDTTGLVQGAVGRKLKTYKADLIRPDYLIGIQKKREIEHLLMPFTKISSVKVRRVRASEQVKRKPPAFREARRRLNFYSHFHDVSGHIIRLEDIVCWNTWFTTGRPLKWQYIKFIEDSLRCRVLHAEITGTGLFIISERLCASRGHAEVEQEFKTSNINIVTADIFRNLLVGLADENGTTLNVGLIQAIDFKQRFMFLLSPIKTVSPVRVVQFGSIRVTREGEQIGTIKQGEL